jgi:hypothetical protein
MTPWSFSQYLKLQKEISTMGCCGQKRAALTSAQPVRATGHKPTQSVTSNRKPSVGTPQQAAIPKETAYSPLGYSSVALRYTEISPILVRGPVSSRQYRFSRLEPVQSVDGRDALALLRTGFFRQS